MEQHLQNHIDKCTHAREQERRAHAVVKTPEKDSPEKLIEANREAFKG